MDYKEKYEKAVQAAMLAKQDTESAVTIGILEEIFPELKEGEDERIIERIKKAVESYWSDEPLDEILAWLEKQGNANKEYWRGYREGKQEILDKYTELGKQGEQKPAEWSEEDEKMIRGLIVICDEWTTRHSFYPIENCEIEKLKNWLKSLKDRVLPKQEWKQENTGDLTNFENTMMHIGDSFFGDNAGLDPNDTNTIKEQANLLLELVPKQEWSEEDESMRTRCIGILGKCYMGELPTKVEEELNWLKSLRPQSQWKPSDEQMEVLLGEANAWTKGCPKQEILESLYNDLKKLRKE